MLRFRQFEGRQSAQLLQLAQVVGVDPQLSDPALGDDGLALALADGRQMPAAEWEQLVAIVLAGSVETVAF